MSGPHVVYAQHSEVSTEAEFSTLAAVYRFIVDRHVNQDAAGMTCTKGAILRTTEGVSDVEQRPD